MAGPFATATELASLTGMLPQDDLSREQLLIELASATIRAFCKQTLSAVTGDVVTVYPTASTFLSLPERPVTAVSQVLVDGVATTDYYVVPRGIRSGTVASPGSAWTRGATVTYSHGYAETSEEFRTIKSICLSMASAAFTMNRDSASMAMGNEVMETAGYGPKVFLTQGDKETLRRFKPGPVR
jgi:hypothetical protein